MFLFFLRFYYTAKRIQQNIDTTVNPCENFYQYACGSWGKNNPVPEGRDTWSDNNIVFDKSKKRIKGKKIFSRLILMLEKADGENMIASLLFQSTILFHNAHIHIFLNFLFEELLEEHISSTDIPPVRMVKEFYRSCMNVGRKIAVLFVWKFSLACA